MTDHENLLVLAGWLIGDDWNWYDIEGLERQEMLVKQGMIIEVTATEADVGKYSEFEVGDTICKLTELGKAARAAWRIGEKK